MTDHLTTYSTTIAGGWDYARPDLVRFNEAAVTKVWHDYRHIFAENPSVRQIALPYDVLTDQWELLILTEDNLNPADLEAYDANGDGWVQGFVRVSDRGDVWLEFWGCDNDATLSVHLNEYHT